MVRTAIIAIGCLLMAGCDDMPQARTKAEIREIVREESAGIANTVSHNSGVGNRRDAEVKEELDELRRRVSRLESENERLQSQINLIN